MGNFDKKSIIKKAENIIEEYNESTKRERKEIITLKKDCMKLKKINTILKIAVSAMAVALIIAII